MNNIQSYIIYPTFVIAVLLLVAVFVTSTSYTQLGVAVLVYSILAFLGYKIFVDRGNDTATAAKVAAPQSNPQADIKTSTNISNDNKVSVSDIDKRAFLKFLSLTGVSFFLFSLFGNRSQSFFSNPKGQPQSTTPNGNIAASTNATDGYNIVEVDDDEISYSGFMNEDGAWYIIRGDVNNGSYRYARGKSDFPGSWAGREKLKYDYYNKVF